MPTGWNQRFLASTRGQVVALLRQGQATVDELARQLHLTDNAVRAHLAALERDGLVSQRGVRRGAGKPAFVYALTPAAENLFPKAYGTLLHDMLDVLGEQMSQASREELMREVGHRLAAGQPRFSGDLPERAAGAVELLARMGGLAAVEQADGELAIVGRSCPLAAAVAGHPETCLVAETLLTDVIGVPVRQRCEPDIPRCRFEVAPFADRP
jgi:predicted ArsR family transcriptional regulator